MKRLPELWRALEHDQQLAAIAAIGLFVSMFLPWYSQTDTVVVGNTAHASQASLSAFASFSFVEAAVLLVSAGVLGMLFARADGRAFRLPGGDGTIVLLAGCWAALLIFYRTLDKPGLHGTQRITATVGVKWGIFVALAAAGLLAYAGSRMRAARHREPPLTRRTPASAPAGGPQEPWPATAPPAGGSQEPWPATAPPAGGSQEPWPASAPPPRAPGAGGEQRPPARTRRGFAEQRSPLAGAEPQTPAGRGESPPARSRPRYPPAPAAAQRRPPRRPVAAPEVSEQLSFEDPATEPGRRPA
jgi:hypothetical protein